MRIACVSYRDWALAIYDGLAGDAGNEAMIVRSREEFDEDALVAFKPELMLFYGWSWKVSDRLLGVCDCLMLHPAPLPKYRGGSPLQNQIIAGEKTSAVTLFVMTDEMDAGGIVAQEAFSLEGHLDDILARITETGLRLTREIIRDGYTPVAQVDADATYVKRRTPAESELTLEELTIASAEHLFNKIRMLEDPYPNAFLRTPDGKRLVIKRAEIVDD
jgi:methionyl-tRNA formyltransferase